MAYNTPSTPATGGVISSAFGNTVVNDLEWIVNNRPRARVRRTTAQSVPTSTNTAIAFDAERWDVGSCHNGSSNTSRLTVPSGGDGLYLIGGCLVLASSTTWDIMIRLNGSTEIARQQTTAARSAVSTLYELSAGDYVELCCAQFSGGNLNVNVEQNQSPEFWFCWQANKA